MDKNSKNDHDNHIPQPENVKHRQQSQEEQALNKKAVDGEKVNQQIEQKRDHHQPRDTA